MKYVWEGCDVHAGRRIHSHNRAEGYIIVYTYGGEKGSPRYGWASLIDGQVAMEPKHTKQILAAILNNYGMVPDDVRADSDRMPGVDYGPKPINEGKV